MYKRTTCRCCLGNKLEKVWSLGPTPLADGFMKTPDEIEKYYPLDVNFCTDCGFLQLAHVLPLTELFPDNYTYRSSTSPVFVKHFESLAESIEKNYHPKFVVDIGSNDGVLLKPLQRYNIEVLGIEPASEVAKEANDRGINTIAKPFTLELAKELASDGKADVITGANVFAHIDDMDEVIDGVKELLTDDGVFIVEVQYLLDLLTKVQLGLVYHEHLSYWSIRTLKRFFERKGMYIDRFEYILTHNGSIRVYVKKGDKFNKITVSGENKLGLINTYKDFNKAMLNNKVSLITLLTKLKNRKKKIVGYGAAAKCMTPLNFFSIGTETLDYIVDDSITKQGLYTPGKRIPVVPADRLYEDRPDYILLTAWNFAASIMNNHPGFKYIMPVPEPIIL